MKKNDLFMGVLGLVTGFTMMVVVAPVGALLIQMSGGGPACMVVFWLSMTAAGGITFHSAATQR